MSPRRRIDVLGGGTIEHVRAHLALCAPAFGATAHKLVGLFEAARAQGHFPEHEVRLHLTKMADPSSPLETNEDVAERVDRIVEDAASHVVVVNVAFADFRGDVLDERRAQRARLSSRAGPVLLRLVPTEKVLRRIRKERKDLFLVAFKATAGATPREQYRAALRLLKEASCNLVLANDVITKHAMVVTPEQARYHEGERDVALAGLVEMTALRSRGTFTRSTIVPGEPVAWSSAEVPRALRAVVDHCIARGAYRPFEGSTVGHFAAKVDGGTFLTSRRKTNLNRMSEVGLVKIETEGHDRVIAHGSRPSVGGQSQRIVFAEHPELDCIVHFHCAMRPGARVPIRPQRPYECGSHECGRNTSKGLAPLGPAWAVMLEGHGPNIVFSRRANPESIIRLIEESFDFDKPTDEDPVESPLPKLGVA